MDEIKIYRTLEYKSRCLIDPLKPYEVLISPARIPGYLMEEYGLTQQELSNLVNGFDRCHIHTCPICGKPLRFLRLSRGFEQACCISHKQMIIMQDKDRLLKNVTALNSTLSQASGRFTQFMDKGSPDDPGEFYFAIADNETYYKFGITCNPDERYWFNCLYKSHHVVIKGTRIFIASLERDLKVFLNQNHEYFNSDQFKNIKNFIRHYVKKSRTP